VRFFPYRGAIRKEGAAKRSSPLSRSGLSFGLNFQRALERWLSRFLEGTQACLEPSLQVSRSAQTNFRILRSATHSLLALEHSHQLNVQLLACKPLLHVVMGDINMLLGRASKSETLSSASKINIIHFNAPPSHDLHSVERAPQAPPNYRRLDPGRNSGASRSGNPPSQPTAHLLSPTVESRSVSLNTAMRATSLDNPISRQIAGIWETSIRDSESRRVAVLFQRLGTAVGC